MSSPSITKHDTEGKSACGEVGATGSRLADAIERLFDVVSDIKGIRFIHSDYELP